MSQRSTTKEFSLPVEFDSVIKEGIGLPPKIVLEFKTQYQKIISVRRAGEAISLSGRIVPVPASYHDRSVVVLPEKWEKAYDIAPSVVMCKLIEPSFANTVKLEVVEDEKSNSLPALEEYIEDKSVIFKGQYIREKKVIYQVLQINDGETQAITKEDTVLTFSDDYDVEPYSVGDENREGSVEGSPKVEERGITFENLHKIKGIDKTIARLKNEVIYPFIDILNGEVSKPEPMGGVLLYGPPGCGKTEIATSIAKDLGIEFDDIKIGDIASPHVHQFGKNLQTHFNKANKSANGTIIFLDEFDAFAGDRSGMQHSHDKENVNVLLQALDPKNRSPKVLVFAATNYLSTLDTAVTRSGRFDTKIGIGPPDETGRAAILRSKLDNHSLDSSSVTEGVVQKLAKEAIGYVGGDIKALVDKSDTFRKTRARETGEPPTSISIMKEDLFNAVKAVTPLCKTEMDIEQPSINMVNLPGSEEYVKHICAEAELMFHPERFRSDIKVKPNQAFLLYGPPGTGKTSIANATANELNILFQVIDAGELKGGIVGETIKNINKLFENARLFRPILLFFDEIDSIAQHRSSSDQSDASDSINTLLTQLGDTADNKNIIFVGATNRMDIIDPALLRPGRFGTHIEVERPELPSIKAQLNQQLKEIPHQLSKTHIDTLAKSLHKQKRTQGDIADFLNNIKRHLVFNTAEGIQADYSLFETTLDALPTDL